MSHLGRYVVAGDAEGDGDIETVFGAVHGYVHGPVAGSKDLWGDARHLVAKDEGHTAWE